MAHDVLISYSTHDKLQADAICNRLESQGIRCWIAPRDIPLGSEYADAIVHAIETSRVMVLIYSTKADESHQVRREVERAVSTGITIIPVRIEDGKMSEAFQYYVGSMHWLDAITPPLEAHIDKLAHDLKALLTKRPGEGPAPRSPGISPKSNGPADAEPPKGVQDLRSPPPAEQAAKRSRSSRLAVRAGGAILLVLIAAGVVKKIHLPALSPTPTPTTTPAADNKVAVPDLVGKQYSEAERTLLRMGLEPSGVADWDRKFPVDTIIRTEPAKDTRMNPGDTVKLHKSARGGWIYWDVALGRRAALAVGRSVKIRSAVTFHEKAVKSSISWGDAAKQGEKVRILQAQDDGWVQVVIED